LCANASVRVRTWNFTDACGNTSANFVQTITVQDTTAPVAPAAPADTGYQCVAQVPAPGSLTAHDACSGDITVTGVDSDNGGAGWQGSAWRREREEILDGGGGRHKKNDQERRNK